MHERSYIDLPGATAEGNRRADALAISVEITNILDIFAQAKMSHSFYHQNVPALITMFKLTRERAQAIVATCPNCQLYQLPSLGSGINPRGLSSCQIWQTDVTHIPAFGRSKYTHVSLGTFSGAVFALAHAGEDAAHTIKHLLLAFATLGVPKEIKQTIALLKTP